MTSKSKFFWISNFILTLIFISAVALAWNNPPANPPTGSGAIATDVGNNIGIGETVPSARLNVRAVSAVAGSGTVSSSGATVTGVSTSFTTQLKVGDSIIASGQTRVVSAIASNTSLTTNSSFSPVLGAGTAYTYQRAIGSFNDSTGAQQLWIGATGQMGLGTIPGSSTKLGMSASASLIWPIYITTTDGTGRVFGINFSQTAGLTDAVRIGAASATHRLHLLSGGSSQVTVSPVGRVGMGVADVSLDASSARLAVIDPAFPTIPTISPTILLLGSHNGLTTGSSVRARGTVSGALADLTEYIRVVGHASDYEAGDILEIDTITPDLFKKSSSEYSKKLAGVVSRTGGFIMGEDGVEFDENGNPRNHAQLALAGRVPVKVTIKNGAINIGDAITSSSIRGVGMKATHNGRVVGLALEPYSGEEVGYVKILINPHYWIAE